MHTQEMVYFYRNMSQQCVSILYFATGWFRKRISECWFISWGGIKNYLSLEHIFITWTHIYRLNTYLSLEHIFITWTHIYHLNTHLSLEHIRIAWTHIYRLNTYLSLERIFITWTHLSFENIFITWTHISTTQGNTKFNLSMLWPLPCKSICNFANQNICPSLINVTQQIKSTHGNLKCTELSYLFRWWGTRLTLNLSLNSWIKLRKANYLLWAQGYF